MKAIELINDQPHQLDDAPDAPETCPHCCADLSYDDQCREEIMCSDCAAEREGEGL